MKTLPFQPKPAPGARHRLASWILCAAGLLAAAQVPGASAPAENSALELDRMLVIVNNDVITRTELEERMRDAREQLRQRRIQVPDESLLRKQVLEQMIVESIQVQMAKRRGMQVSDAEVEQTIGRIAASRKLTPEAFLAGLQAQHMTPDQFREQLRHQILIRKLTEREINSRVRVSESEVDFFLQTRAKMMGGQDAYNLSHIIIPIPELANAETIARVRRRAEEVLAAIKQGGDFAQAASAYSRGKEALKGGDLGWRSAGQLPELFLEALANMQPGDVSPLIRSPSGFHILRLNDRRSTNTRKTVTQTRARHILLRTSEIQSEAQTLAKMERIIQRLKEGEDFAALARSHSQDPGSAAKGGDLGWTNPGQMVPEFEKAMNALAIGELSQPVRSQFGFHLIQVLERREKDIGSEVDRAEARRQIRSRKADERYQQWIRRIRDEAFVKFLEHGEG